MKLNESIIKNLKEGYFSDRDAKRNEPEEFEGKDININTKFRAKADKIANKYAEQICKEYLKYNSDFEYSEELKKVARSVIYSLINNLSYGLDDSSAYKMVDNK